MTGVVLALALTATACDGGDPPADPEPPKAAACVSVGEGDEAVHLTVPDGFTEDDDPVSVDVLFTGEPESGDVLPPQVALHDFASADEADSDQELLDQALTFAIPFTGSTPSRKEASRRVHADQLAEITFETEATPDDRLYTVHAQLERVDDARFAVVLIAPDRASYDELADAVLPTVAAGGC